MKTAIVYHSYHHGNTKKLVDAIAAKHEVTLVDVLQKNEFDLTGFDVIGFASGIYAFGISKEIVTFAGLNLPDHKKVFYIYTSAFVTDLNLRELGDLFKTRDAEFLGSLAAEVLERVESPDSTTHVYIFNSRDFSNNHRKHQF